MDIETVIVGVVVLALVAVAYKYWPKAKSTLDVNQDGKLDGADAKAAVEAVVVKVEEEVKAEVAKVEEVVKTEVKKAAAKATTKAKAVVNKAAKEVVKETKAPAAVKKSGRPKKSV